MTPRDGARRRYRQSSVASRDKAHGRALCLIVGVLLLGAMVFAPPALAHTNTRAFILLLPTGYYLVGGSAAVAVSFLLLAFLPKSASDRLTEARLGLFALRPPSPVATSTLAFLFLMLLVAAGLWGNRDPLENPLPLTIWTVWWIGFTISTAVFGNLWAYFNPWSGPCRLANAALGRSRHAPLLKYPFRLGYWPAIALFLGFAWYEQIDLAPADPERLAIAVGCYWLANFVAVLLFGEDTWLKRAEPFSVFFRFIAYLSPFVWERVSKDNAGGDDTRHRLTLAIPGAALIGRATMPISGVLFILLTLSLESFDGLSETFWWLGLNGINPLEFPGRSAMVTINSVGLLASWGALAFAYFGAVTVGWLIAGRPGSLMLLLGTLVFSIMPIALCFHFAHYLTALLVDSQYALAAASDPFGTGLNLLGLDGFQVTASFLNTHEGTRAIWDAQTAGIVFGHVLGILLAHLIAARHIGDYRAAVISQAPLAVVMVAYTLFGLWLLSTPVAG